MYDDMEMVQLEGPKKKENPIEGCTLGDAVVSISPIHPIKKLKKGVHLKSVPCTSHEYISGIAVHDIVVDFLCIYSSTNGIMGAQTMPRLEICCMIVEAVKKQHVILTQSDTATKPPVHPYVLNYKQCIIPNPSPLE